MFDTDITGTIEFVAQKQGPLGYGAHGSFAGASYDASTGLWHEPEHMSLEQKAALIYNEARGIDAAHRVEVIESDDERGQQ